jgi:hypothetical protein
MRRTLAALVSCVIFACGDGQSRSRPDTSLGAVDTAMAVHATPAPDTSRAAAIQRAKNSMSRPARIDHTTDEQRRLRNLRLQKAPTTTQRLQQ